MKIGIDARDIQNGVYNGTGRYLANFINEFMRSDHEDTYVLFSEFPILTYKDSRIKNVIIKPAHTFIWDQFHLCSRLGKEKIDLFFSPYYKIPLFAPCKIISTILDLTYQVFPYYKNRMSIFDKLYYLTFGTFCVWRANHILTCSEHSKKDICRLYSVFPSKISVIPLSLSPIYRYESDPAKLAQVREQFNAKDGYILYMGNFKPHKNVATLIEAFMLVAEQFSKLKLVLVGPKTHQYEMLENLAEELQISDKVEFVGTIFENNDPHLIYSAAEMMVIPSCYEGFGLPLIEAMACHTPIAASNYSSIPEVLKKAGLLVPPQDVQGFTDAMLQILSDKDLRSQLVQEGLKNLDGYDSKTIFNQMYTLFNKK
ncbi:MAG: glycosyltransferase family 4 protein [Candidatus Omnitrophica bacterium]|nr:glycosyltransferase family 4 protein [Candidatus Omnitrophota bacterium]